MRKLFKKAGEAIKRIRAMIKAKFQKPKRKLSEAWMKMLAKVMASWVGVKVIIPLLKVVRKVAGFLKTQVMRVWSILKAAYRTFAVELDWWLTYNKKALPIYLAIGALAGLVVYHYAPVAGMVLGALAVPMALKAKNTPGLVTITLLSSAVIAAVMYVPEIAAACTAITVAGIARYWWVFYKYGDVKRLDNPLDWDGAHIRAQIIEDLKKRGLYDGRTNIATVQ